MYVLNEAPSVSLSMDGLKGDPWGVEKYTVHSDEQAPTVTVKLSEDDPSDKHDACKYSALDAQKSSSKFLEAPQSACDKSAQDEG